MKVVVGIDGRGERKKYQALCVKRRQPDYLIGVLLPAYGLHCTSLSPECAAQPGFARLLNCCSARMITGPGFPDQAWCTLLIHRKAALAFYALISACMV